MNYYAEDTSPRRWAVAVTVIYLLLIAVAMAFVSFDFDHIEPEAGLLYIIEEEPAPVAPPKVEPKPTMQPRQHTTPAPEESFDQTDGVEEKVQTVNQRALFKMAKSGVDSPESTGNPRAEQAKEEKAKGSSTGLDTFAGSLDEGLQGRGLLGSLPKPAYTANASGKVLIDVVVDATGKVTKATYRPQGSTTNNAELVEAARRAALKARFTESESMVQGGTITYIFRMR